MATNEIAERPMEYLMSNGDEMRLTINMVRRFLVRGRPELLSEQEIFFFMHVCKARRLNPFTNDCYLIKYGQEPAAIITSVDYFRRNARKAPDCKGWQAGVVVINQDNVVRYSKGLILPGERLIGGWFKAQPAGWSEPFEHEVPLEPFIKKTRDGKVTQFWRPENQPVMIRKVAECQGIRFLWGENTSGMYAPEEIVSDPADLEMKKIDTDRPKDMYAVTHKAPEIKTTTNEPNRKEPYTEWQKEKEPATDGSNQSGDTRSDDDHGHGGPGKDVQTEETQKTEETASKDETTVERALNMCQETKIRKLYKGSMRNAVDLAATSLNIQIENNDYAAAHQSIKDRLEAGNEERSTEATDEGEEEAPPETTSEYIDLLDQFNVAFAEAQKNPEKLMPIFKSALNAANIQTGKRPGDALQAQTFLSSYKNLLKSDEQASSMSKGAEVKEDDPDLIWDELYDFMNTNYSQVHFHLFKNFLAIRSAEGGVPVHELAKMVYTDDEHCRATMTKFKEWSGRTGNEDKF